MNDFGNACAVSHTHELGTRARHLQSSICYSGATDNGYGWLLASISGGIFVAAIVLIDHKDSNIQFIARDYCTDVESCPCPPSVQSCRFGVNTNYNSCAAAPAL